MKYYSLTKCINVITNILKRANVFVEPRCGIKLIDYLDTLLVSISWRHENRIFLKAGVKFKKEMAMFAISANYHINPDDIYEDTTIPTIQLIYKDYIPAEIKLEYLLHEGGVYPDTYNYIIFDTNMYNDVNHFDNTDKDSL